MDKTAVARLEEGGGREVYLPMRRFHAQAALLQATIAKDQVVKNLLDAMGDRPKGADGSSLVHPKVWN